MNRLNLALAAVILSSSAFASEQALITKSNYPGFVPPEYGRSEVCNVYLDRVDIIKSYGFQSGFTVVETRPLSISAGIEQVIEKAAEEELEQTPNFLCDGPTTVISTYLNGQAVTLFYTGACGSPKRERKGFYSRMLREVVDSYCPTTHDLTLE